jgi:phosphoribosyl 1,2-cyclic phosphodiesterase
MKMKKLDIRKVKAVFITHEHSDHMRGVRVLADSHNIPVFFTDDTLQKTRVQYRPDNVKLFEAGESITIGDHTVFSFSKNHDAADPVSFRVEVEGVNVGVFTDIGEPCDNVKQHLESCDAAFLETNYDEQMLWAGAYPRHLKVRVASGRGHLSNDQAKELVDSLASGRLKHLFLSHISADNNRVKFALDTFSDLQDKMNIVATSRYAPSDVLELQPAVQLKAGSKE